MKKHIMSALAESLKPRKSDVEKPAGPRAKAFVRYKRVSAANALDGAKYAMPDGRKSVRRAAGKLKALATSGARNRTLVRQIERVGKRLGAK